MGTFNQRHVLPSLPPHTGPMYAFNYHWYAHNCDGGAATTAANHLRDGRIVQAIMVLRANLSTTNLAEHATVRHMEAYLRSVAEGRPVNGALNDGVAYIAQCQIAKDCDVTYGRLFRPQQQEVTREDNTTDRAEQAPQRADAESERRRRLAEAMAAANAAIARAAQ